MTFILRPYQKEALWAVHDSVCSERGNPCVSTPTGSGKSIMMAALIRQWQIVTPGVRGCILAHRKELVKQNYDKFTAAYLRADDSANGRGPEGNNAPLCRENVEKGNAGIFSAGLGRKDYESNIIFASIDSIYKRSGDFAPFDFIFVDEAHRIPFSGEGKYRTFLSGCRRFNSRIRIVGWTATAWRMAGGKLCHPDHILTHLCYESKITELIKDGYLCNLRSKVGISQPDLSEVERYSGGDYKVNSLAKVVDNASIVSDAVSEAVRIIVRENRRYAIFYCVDISHAEKVSKALASLNVYAPYITSKTKPHERDKIISDFKEGRIHAICNVNVLTEGFDAPIVDCIVLLRPTLSAGLFSQMVGRGLRTCESKHDCLVLDFAGCIDEHGPIDLLGGQRVVEAVCQQCREVFSRALRACPYCGWEIPKREVERIEAVEKEKRMHGVKASRRSILSNEPETLKVDTIYVSRHKKPGNPDSVRLQFRCGLRMFRHWVCLDHPGTPGSLAQRWWRRFHSAPRETKFTVNEVLGDLFVSQHLIEKIHTITVRKNGKYFEITEYNNPIVENAV